MKNFAVFGATLLLLFLSAGCEAPLGSTPYTVTYDGNGATGGTVPSASGTYLQGAFVPVLGNSGSLVKAGYVFAGWNTAADGSGGSYAVSATLTMGAANVTLYAVWTSIQTVSFDLAYGQLSFASVSTQVAKGSPVTLSTNNASLASEGTSWSWRLDGVVLAGMNGSVLNLDTASLQIGAHNLDVFVMWQGILYSANLALTVTN